jgi:hypothetical protein
MAVEDDVIPVREDALDLAMCVRTIGLEHSDELAEPVHAVPDERIVLAIGGSTIEAERVLNGAVAELVGIDGGVVSGVINLESSGVEASDWRPRHDERYQEV